MSPWHHHMFDSGVKQGLSRPLSSKITNDGAGCARDGSHGAVRQGNVSRELTPSRARNAQGLFGPPSPAQPSPPPARWSATDLTRVVAQGLLSSVSRKRSAPPFPATLGAFSAPRVFSWTPP